MKSKNKAKRLQARQKDYDEMVKMVKSDLKLKESYRKPGSMRK